MKNKLLTYSLLAMTVLVIAMLLLWYFMRNGSSAEYKKGYKKTKSVMAELWFPILTFEEANGKLPVSLDDMRQYFSSKQFKSTRYKDFNLKDYYYDAWGTPIIWGQAYGHPKYEVFVKSAGPDLKFGTNDDFEEWIWRCSKEEK